jgi:hypothetical protein
MKDAPGNRGSGPVFGLAVLVAVALLPVAVTAHDLTSAGVRLRGGTLSGGGEISLHSTAPGSFIGSVGVTIGQSAPIGTLTGPISGIILQAGVWPVLAVDEVTPLACDDSLDNDGDGFIDLADPGCADAGDSSEKDDTGYYPCDDAVDNDADSYVDYPDDPGCYNPHWFLENPACENGIDDDGDGLTDLADPACLTPFMILENPLCQNGSDDDGDGLIDFDGGQAVHGACSAGSCPPGVSDPDRDGVANPDPECFSPGTFNEKECGLGIELAFLLPPLMCFYRKQKRGG